MSETSNAPFFGVQQLALQAQFETQAMAERIASVTMHREVQEQDKAFIESRDMFFLASVDANGQPSCAYKGGEPGFVRVLDEHTIVFPSYDGNGMFLSMGNINATAKIGMLFLDFEKPNRLRLHGTASIMPNDPLLAAFPGADLVVRVAVTEIFVNCPRYLHRYEKVAASPYVPKADASAPFAQWKRIDLLQDVLPPRDQGKLEGVGGTITFEDYAGKLARGEG
jgi:predicted pyridoxine 5'-phosphate oxidase superfamily flavin-nucleotide-binding protein